MLDRHNWCEHISKWNFHRPIGRIIYLIIHTLELNSLRHESLVGTTDY